MKNWSTRLPIKIFFFGNFNGKKVYAVTHQNFPSKFPFLEISMKKGSTRSPIKFSFFGNFNQKGVYEVIHQNFLFWKIWSKMGLRGHPSKFPFLEILIKNGSTRSSIKISFPGKSHDLLMSAHPINRATHTVGYYPIRNYPAYW